MGSSASAHRRQEIVSCKLTSANADACCSSTTTSVQTSNGNCCSPLKDVGLESFAHLSIAGTRCGSCIDTTEIPCWHVSPRPSRTLNLHRMEMAVQVSVEVPLDCRNLCSRSTSTELHIMTPCQLELSPQEACLAHIQVLRTLTS